MPVDAVLAPACDVVTIDDRGPNAFGSPSPLLSAHERRAFAVGNSFFRQNWVTAPSSTTGR
ncbi:MAG TPA: thiol oxidoreductase, partial [Planctomycetota bacterium]|nr:thiol oxidoreductase [Planctomycetota bacterium]